MCVAEGSCVIGSLAKIMKRSNVSMELKRTLRNSILLLTLTYESETCIWDRIQQSRVHAVEMSYLIGTCIVTRWDSESNESMYERCSI